MSFAQVDKILTEQSLSKLHIFLKKQSNDSLAAVSTHDPLDQLNPAVHSLGYLFVLKARVARPANKDSAQSVMQRIAVFLQSFDPKQVRAAPAEFHDLVFAFAEICDKNLQIPIFALASLKIAIHRYAKSPSHLTSIHYIFVKQCLLAKCFDEALGLLDILIDDLDLGTDLVYQHYLQYYYYGSMIYISLKKFQNAYDFAKIVITAPGSACSAIQLEAYKKFILLSLILHGKMSPIPSTVSQAAARAFKHLSRPYEELAQSLKDPDAIQGCLQTHDSIFTEDKNLGLVSQAVKQQEMTRIAALGESYLAISVEDVARKLYGPKSLENLPEDLQRLEYLVLQMIDQGHLNATISGSPPVIHFFDNVNLPSRQELESVLSSISSINNKLKTLDREISLSKSYISKSATKPGQGRGMSPVDGESDIRWKLPLRDTDPLRKSGRNKGGSQDNGVGSKFPNIPFDDKMED